MKAKAIGLIGLIGLMGLGEPPAVTPAAPAGQQGSSWERLSADEQAKLAEFATTCRRDCEGRVWTGIMCEQLVEAREKKDAERAARLLKAPLWYELGGERSEDAQTEESLRARLEEGRRKAWVEECEARQAVAARGDKAAWAQRERRKAELVKAISAKGHTFLNAVEVNQVVAEGLLCHDPDAKGGVNAPRFLLVGWAGQVGVTDGKKYLVELEVEEAGRFQYTSTAGALRTVARLKVVRMLADELPKVVKTAVVEPPKPGPCELAPVTAEELAAFVEGKGLPGVPMWEAQKVQLNPARAASKGRAAEPARYDYRWVRKWYTITFEKRK